MVVTPVGPQAQGKPGAPSNMEQVISMLAQEYGVPDWQPRRDPVSELIYTILSQNTSDANSLRAYQRLEEAFGGWEAVARSSPTAIAKAIWLGGLARSKAPRIKQALQGIIKRRGSLDLSFLEALPLAEAKAWLRQLPGVGPKTAACVLLFSLGRPALPVDTHLYRLALRLGLLSKVSAEKAHQILEDMVPPGQVYQFHVNMVRHGRRICRAQRPHCPQCILREICPSWPQFWPGLVQEPR